MNNLEAFTHIRKHLLKQNKKAIDPDGLITFIAKDGCRCALGSLFVDLTYEGCVELCYDENHDDENHGSKMRAYRDAFVSDNNLDVDLMADLENLHDHTEPETWDQELKDIARDYSQLLEV